MTIDPKDLAELPEAELPEGSPLDTADPLEMEEVSADVSPEAEIDMPTLALEDYEIPDEEIDAVELKVQGATRYAFIGIGQGGCGIADAMAKQGWTKTLAVNTALQDLRLLSHIPREHRLWLGPQGAQVLSEVGDQASGHMAGGAGKDMHRGEEAVVRHQQEIYDLMRKVFGRGIDQVIVCAGAGGGTGSGGVEPLVTILSKKYLENARPDFVGSVDRHVGVLLTLPREDEARNAVVAANALSVAEAMSAKAEEGVISPLVIIDNARIRSMYPKIPQLNLWPTVNEHIAQMWTALNWLPLQASPMTSFDPSDYETVIRAGGHMVMGLSTIPMALIEKETEVSKIMRHSLDKTMLAEGFDLSTAQVSAVAICGSRKTLQTVPNDVLEYVFDMAGRLTGGRTLHQGIYVDKRDGLRVYFMVSGLSRPEKRYDRLRVQAREKYP